MLKTLKLLSFVSLVAVVVGYYINNQHSSSSSQHSSSSRINDLSSEETVQEKVVKPTTRKDITISSLAIRIMNYDGKSKFSNKYSENQIKKMLLASESVEKEITLQSDLLSLVEEKSQDWEVIIQYIEEHMANLSFYDSNSYSTIDVLVDIGAPESLIIEFINHRYIPSVNILLSLTSRPDASEVLIQKVLENFSHSQVQNVKEKISGMNLATISFKTRATNFLDILEKSYHLRVDKKHLSSGELTLFNKRSNIASFKVNTLPFEKDAIEVNNEIKISKEFVFYKKELCNVHKTELNDLGYFTNLESFFTYMKHFPQEHTIDNSILLKSWEIEESKREVKLQYINKHINLKDKFESQYVILNNGVWWYYTDYLLFTKSDKELLKDLMINDYPYTDHLFVKLLSTKRWEDYESIIPLIINSNNGNDRLSLLAYQFGGISSLKKFNDYGSINQPNSGEDILSYSIRNESMAEMKALEKYIIAKGFIPNVIHSKLKDLNYSCVKQDEY